MGRVYKGIRQAHDSSSGGSFSTLFRGTHTFENRPIKGHQRMTEISPKNNSLLSRQQWAHPPTEIEAAAPSPVQTYIWAFGARPHSVSGHSLQEV